MIGRWRNRDGEMEREREGESGTRMLLACVGVYGYGCKGAHVGT